MRRHEDGLLGGFLYRADRHRNHAEAIDMGIAIVGGFLDAIELDILESSAHACAVSRLSAVVAGCRDAGSPFPLVRVAEHAVGKGTAEGAGREQHEVALLGKVEIAGLDREVPVGGRPGMPIGEVGGEPLAEVAADRVQGLGDAGAVLCRAPFLDGSAHLPVARGQIEGGIGPAIAQPDPSRCE